MWYQVKRDIYLKFQFYRNVRKYIIGIERLIENYHPSNAEEILKEGERILNEKPISLQKMKEWFKNSEFLILKGGLHDT